MNTRLQVEHPVTEMITNTDLVALQVLVAEGKELPFKQEDLSINGHAFECRIYAEDPADNFLPSTGLLKKHRVPTGSGIRVDAGVEEGQQITINYDPMISKLSVHGPDRETARKRMLRALDEYEIAGCKTTIPFCEFTLNHPAFIEARYDTHFVPDHFTPEKMQPELPIADIALTAALLKNGAQEKGDTPKVMSETGDTTLWWKNRRNS